MDSCWAKWPLWYFSKWPLWGYDDGRWWYDRAPIQAPHRISLLPQHLGAQMQVLMSWVMDQLNPGGIWNKKNNCRIRVKGHITWIFFKKKLIFGLLAQVGAGHGSGERYRWRYQDQEPIPCWEVSWFKLFHFAVWCWIFILYRSKGLTTYDVYWTLRTL